MSPGISVLRLAPVSISSRIGTGAGALALEGGVLARQVERRVILSEDRPLVLDLLRVHRRLPRSEPAATDSAYHRDPSPRKCNRSSPVASAPRACHSKGDTHVLPG